MSFRTFLVLSALAASVYAADSDKTTAIKMNIHVKETWETTTVSVLAGSPSSAAPSELKVASSSAISNSTAKRALVEIRDLKGRPYEFRVFAVKLGLETWIGPEQHLYLETSRGPLGVSVSPGGFLNVWESLDPEKSRQSDGAELDLITKSIDGARLLEPTARIDLRKGLNPFFFAAAPFSMEPGQATIRGASLNGNFLTLDLRSPAGDYSAMITIDLRKQGVIKTVDDGREVFSSPQG